MSIADRLHHVEKNLVLDVFGSVPDFSIQFHCAKLFFRPAVDLLEFYGRGIDQSLARARPFPAEELQLFGLELVSGDKELLDLLAHLLGQITRIFVGLFPVGVAWYGDQPVIADTFCASPFAGLRAPR
jgi:hypothetical protein